MSKEKCGLPSIRALRQSVADVLAVRENRLTLILSQILLLIFVALYVTLNQVFFAIDTTMTVELHNALAYLLFAAYVLILVFVSLFLTLPCVIGFLRMAGKMERGETVVTAELFAIFSDKHLYRDALRLSWRAFWRIAVTVLTVTVTLRLSTHFFAGKLLAGLLCGVVVLFELIGGAWLILHGFSLLADVMMCTEQTLCQAKADTVGGYRAGMHFFAGFLPFILLGILSYGILLLWEVFPSMAIGYFRYCRELRDQNLNIHSEEQYNE